MEFKDFFSRKKKDLSPAQEREPGILFDGITTFDRNQEPNPKLYDESFSLNYKNGDFAGECGASYAEHKTEGGVVSGIEVWLFDKNDIHTQTVFVAPENFKKDVLIVRENNTDIKMEIVKARPGKAFLLQTRSLTMETTVLQAESDSLQTNRLSIKILARNSLEVLPRNS